MNRILATDAGIANLKRKTMKNNDPKIINIESTPETKQPEPLTMQQAQNIGSAYARLIEIRAQKVLTVNSETEVRGLIEFLSNELIAHTDELIASWLAVRTEYEVLLNTVGRMMNRIDGIRAAHAQRRAKQNEV